MSDPEPDLLDLLGRLRVATEDLARLVRRLDEVLTPMDVQRRRAGLQALDRTLPPAAFAPAPSPQPWPITAALPPTITAQGSVYRHPEDRP